MADVGDQITLLWNYMFPHIEKQILDEGNFTSWATKLTAEGTIEASLSTLPRTERARFRATLREQAASGRFVAIASATNVAAEVAEAADPLAGILLEFDSTENVSQAFFYPYTVVEGSVVLGELHVEDGDHAIFSAPPPPMPVAPPPKP